MQTSCVFPDEIFTLDPLRTDGPDSLVPNDDDTAIIAVKLRRIELAIPNAFHEVTIKSADDLFRCAAATGRQRNLFPVGAELLRVTLAFLFKGSLTPHTVQIAPPANLILECPDDEPRISRFLSQHRFTVAKAAQTAAVLLLSLFLALPSLADAIDPNEDDDNDDRRAAYHSTNRPPATATHSSLVPTHHSALTDSLTQ
jgi:hypothetical protein